MTRDVEERIVAMYFDNEDFEKKAKTTIETLGQLQKGLNLEDAAKGFGVFDKLSKAMNLDKAQKTLTKIKTTVGGMGSIFKKVFNLGPIDEAAAAVENFKNRYLNRVLGFDLAHTVANALEGAFRQLTIQPISAGWTQYENKMDSVKTIMSSTGESIGTVQTHLQDLTTYANKTIYSLSDMTSNLGKFTNNGMKLQDSVSAMKGIANAAADAGQGAQQASMAMYNFSQAMGVGKMTTIDWKSIENANMATTRLKETFMEMAAANGTLHKEFDETSKKYHYYITKNSKGKKEKDKKKWTEVTARNFRETLSKDWLTSDAMMHALQVYSGDVIDPDVLKSWGITDPEQIEALKKIGENALEAATQVRTFTKMMDALKEAAQSGWADTFELIFGNMEQGTTLWTSLNDIIDPILSKSAKARNDMLQIWAGTSTDTTDEETELQDKIDTLKDYEKKLSELGKTGKDAKGIAEAQEHIKLLRSEINELQKVIEKKKTSPKSIFLDEQGRTGREILFDKETGALFRLIELAQKVGDAFSTAFKSVFGEMDAEKLFNLTKRVGDGVENLFKWFTESTGKEPSRLDKITTGLKGVFSVIKTVVNFIKIGFNLLKKLVSPVADVLINAFEKFGEFFNGLGELSPVEVFEKLGEGLQKTWEKVKKFFTPQDILDKNGKATGQTEIPVITWLKNVWSKFKKTVQGWAEENGLGEVWTKVTDWWNTAKSTFERGKAKLDKVWNDVKGWFASSGISGFLSNTWSWIVSQFSSSGNVVSGYRNGKLESWYEEAPVVSWLSGIWEGIKTFWNETILGTAMPVWEAISEFAGNTWGWITDQFGSKMKSGYRNGRLESWYEEAPVVSWLSGIWESIESFWNETILGTATPIWNAIAQFGSDTWGWITSQFTPKISSGYRNGRLESWVEKPPIVTWLSGIWEGIESFWNETILGTATPIWEAIAKFGSDTWGWITSQFAPKLNSGYRNGRLESWYDQAPVVSWLSGIWESIESFWNNTILGTAMPVWEAISEFAGNTWSWICGLFGKSEDGNKDNVPEENAIITWLKQAWKDIETFWNDTIVGSAKPIWESIAKFGSDTWGWIVSQFSAGKSVTSGYRNGRLESWYEEAPIVTWLSTIWEGVKGVWDEIVGWSGWSALGEFLSNTWTWITGLFAGSESSVAGASEAAVEASKQATTTPEQTEEALGFFERIIGAISDFITKVAEAVGNNVIPPGVSEFFNSIGVFLEGVLTIISKVLGSFGRVASGKAQDGDWGVVITFVIGIIGGIVAKLLAAKWLSGMSPATDIGTQFLEMAGGLLLMASAISLLTTIDPTKMQDGAKVLAALALALGVVLYAVGTLKATATQTPTTGVERFFSNLVNKAAMVGSIYILVNALPSIIGAIQKAKEAGVTEIGDDILKIAEGLSLLFGSIALTMGILNTIAPQGINPAAAIKTALAVGGVALAMVGIFEVIGGIPSLIGEAVEGDQMAGVDAAVAMIDRGGIILSALGIAIGNFFGSLIGAFGGGVVGGAAISASEGLEESTKILSKISMEDLDKFTMMIGFVGELKRSLGGSTLESLGTMANLGILGKELPKLGDGMVGILEKMKDVSSEDMEKLRESMRFISYFANAISLVSSAVTGKQDWLGRVTINQTVFQEYVKAAEQLSEAVKKGLTNEDGTMNSLEFNAMPIIDAICVALEGGEYAISNAVKKMVNAGLQRVDTDGHTGYDRLTVPEEVVTYFQQLQGKYTTENGEIFDLNSLISQFVGDDGEYKKLMDQFDTKITDVDAKWSEFTKVFENVDFLKATTINPETGEEIEVSTISMFQEQMDSLSKAIEEAGGLEVTITPVFTMENMTRDKLQSALDAELGGIPLSANATISNPVVTIDFREMSAELGIEDIRAKLQSLILAVAIADSNNQNAISRLSSDIDSVADAVAGMQMYLDGDVLVGQITPRVDVMLGRRSQVYDRTGVTFNIPKMTIK